ncbi:MAG: pimeloyl-ACP methyl ester carboxylesterase [Planctomycetota bacterium]|jgi:pimeloyl-ACP methyl ester carboxylesterase
MILSLLLAVSSAPLAPAPAASLTLMQDSDQSRLDDRARDRALVNRGMLTNNATFGGSLTTGAGGAVAGVQRTHLPGLFSIVLDDPGTGWQETFLMGVPTNPIQPKAPLLVMFHSYSVSEWDCYVNTPIFQDALDRGWYVVAPLGAHAINFGIPYAQTNIEYALDFVTGLLPVDMDRVYGVGFSMGGGTMMSYAARHIDPDHVRFAAVVNHTGGVSISNTYWNSTDTVYFDDPQLFGGSPTGAREFIYSQASVVDIDLSSSVVNPQTDQARNMAHIPVLNHYASSDPLQYLVNQVDVLYAWLQLIPSIQSLLDITNFSTHHWTTLGSNTTLDFLEPKTLLIPRLGTHRALADREATYFHFRIHQDAAELFTPFRWNMDQPGNRLTIDETANLERIEINTASLGLDLSVEHELVLSTNDSLTEIATIKGYASIPQEVLRDDITDSTWVWDPLLKTVTITELAPTAAAVWKIRP